MTLDAPGSSPSSDSDEYDEHNMWNSMLELLCHEHIDAFTVAYLEDVVLGRIALTCHFALGSLCDKTFAQ